ncbi:MAG: ABC transporter ATP-binding protein, partial [Thermicanus sp.]|nr:ABC transporter ATP-binding protein [Thermicanus sp.]
MIRLLRFLKPYRLFLFSTLILLFFQAITELYLPTLMAEIVDVGVVQGDLPFILRTGGWMLLVAILGMVASVAAGFFSAKTSVGFGRDLRSELFTRIEGFSLHEFDRIGTASLITRTGNDITQVQQVLLLLLRMMISAPLMFAGGVMMAVSKDPLLSLVLIGVLPVLGVVIGVIATKGIPLFQSMQKKLDRLNVVLRENLTGIRVIRAFHKMDYEKERFDQANRDLTKTAVRVNQILASLMPIIMLTMNGTIVAILWFGGIRIDQGQMQVGDLMAFIQYAMMILFSLLMVSMMFVMIPRASASAARIREVLETTPQIKDPEGDGIDSRGLRGVEFREVTFRYPGAEEPVLKRISFQAKPGQVTAIIGGTGSGKTTLLNLILRFYEPEEGEIRVDGVDIRKIPQERLRENIGYAPQKAVLFSGTIAENIRFGKEEATDEEVYGALEAAQAVEFVSQMEGGFEARITQGGTNLSGGQKQRLAIARALVRKPEIYLFDDTSSALDYRTDAKVREALKEVTKDKTVILVAQRVRTVMDADQ